MPWAANWVSLWLSRTKLVVEVLLALWRWCVPLKMVTPLAWPLFPLQQPILQSTLRLVMTRLKISCRLAILRQPQTWLQSILHFRQRISKPSWQYWSRTLVSILIQVRAQAVLAICKQSCSKVLLVYSSCIFRIVALAQHWLTLLAVRYPWFLITCHPLCRLLKTVS